VTDVRKVNMLGGMFQFDTGRVIWWRSAVGVVEIADAAEGPWQYVGQGGDDPEGVAFRAASAGDNDTLKGSQSEWVE
jgi:hypothetical protein